MIEKVFSVLWIFVGVIFLIVGIVALNNGKEKEINCTSKTYGKVINIVEYSNSDSLVYYPVFEYNIGELKFIKEFPWGSYPSKYVIGQYVEVYYSPENYNEYYIAGDTSSKIFGISFIIFGIITIMGHIGCFKYLVNQKKKASWKFSLKIVKTWNCLHKMI